ncbi:MAG: restriction endonuclease [Clostridiales bacterium]|nr:restriction endonuclease [Clostridiales bacterium]
MADNVFKKLEILIVKQLENRPVSRVQLLDSVTHEYCKTHKIAISNRSNSKCLQIKSYVGTIINSLLLENKIITIGDKYSLPTELVNLDSINCLTPILQMLSTQKLTKKEIFAMLDNHFGTNKTVSKCDDDKLHSIAGQVLNECLKNGTICYSQGKYFIDQRPLDKTALEESGDKDTIFAKLFALLHKKGGKYFESFVCNLLEKYYNSTDRQVTYCSVTGGSNDGGIDCVIDTVDYLGFTEHILIQCKCRNSILVSEKEVREFVGAVNIQDGSRGIFVTTTEFHNNAISVLSTINNCVGINKAKLIDIIDKTGYGISKLQNGKYALDRNILR